MPQLPTLPIRSNKSTASSDSPSASRPSRVAHDRFESPKDTIAKVVLPFSSKNQKLCTRCAQIPFGGCLQDQTEISKFVYVTNLEHVMKMQEHCPSCQLLLRCLRQPENDLLKPDHIREHLKDSEQLKSISSFNEWLDWYSKRRITDKVTGGEDAWPFGYTWDPKEAPEAMDEAAKELFLSAEMHDIGAKSSPNFSTKDAVNHTLHLASLGINVATLVKPGIGGREMAGVRLALGEATQLWQLLGRSSKRLPCSFVIRAYGMQEAKAGAISVRAFAYGRGVRAPLKELCHFTLRVEGSEALRCFNGQLWYGRPLQRKVDFELFKKCLGICTKDPNHQRTCWSEPWAVREGSRRDWKFRLVDVVEQKIVLGDFASPKRFDYVALSYVWGRNTPARDQELLLTPDNMDLFECKNSLVDANIRPTIRDAMEIVKSMGQTHLWVDQLCVLQGDLTGRFLDEKNSTLESMGRIYHEALFTIVDGNSGDSGEGMLGRVSQRDVSRQISADVKLVSTHVHLFLPTAMPNDLSTWESRAWTFQEKILSRRMLVFCDGFAQWQCQEAVWREDVNARDFSPPGEAVIASYLQRNPQPGVLCPRAKFGLREDDDDGSLRIYRTSAFRQYARCVQDYTLRATRDPSQILEACEGILDILTSKDLMDSRFLHGLPRDFIDMALLWQPGYLNHRREVRKINKSGGESLAPPSWSWAGWELHDQSKRHIRSKLPVVQGDPQSEGPGVFYRTPFEVQFDAEGFAMRLNAEGEERIRPWASIFCITTLEGSTKLTPIGLFGSPGAQQVFRDTATSYENWEHMDVGKAPEIDLRGLDDNHLVMCTQEAVLYIGRPPSTSQQRRYAQTTERPPIDVQFDHDLIGDHEAREGLIFGNTTTERPCGSATFVNMRAVPSNAHVPVHAIVLSEAQYLGNETRPDVLGYPLYNIMLVEYGRDSIARRFGLGKVRKTAWKRATPNEKVVVLG